jgi:hypothetical protein
MTENETINDYLPKEIIDFFLDGRYATQSDRTTKYNYLAWSLYLRGIYRYYVEDSNGTGHKGDHGGYCVIDIKNDQFKIRGIRVFKNIIKAEKKEGDILYDIQSGDNVIEYWKSGLATLSPDNLNANLEFVYSLDDKISNSMTTENGLDKFKTLLKGQTEMSKYFLNPDDPYHDRKGTQGFLKEIYNFLKENSFWDEMEKIMSNEMPHYALVQLKRDLTNKDQLLIEGGFKSIERKTDSKNEPKIKIARINWGKLNEQTS